VFGQTMHRKNNKYGSKNTSNYQRLFGGARGSMSIHRDATEASSKGNEKQLLFNEIRARKDEMMHQVEASFGLQRFVYEENQSSSVLSKRGWLYNMIQTTVRIISGSWFQSNCTYAHSLLPSCLVDFFLFSCKG
jgi:hypothetical protein